MDSTSKGFKFVGAGVGTAVFFVQGWGVYSDPHQALDNPVPKTFLVATGTDTSYEIVNATLGITYEDVPPVMHTVSQFDKKK